MTDSCCYFCTRKASRYCVISRLLLQWELIAYCTLLALWKISKNCFKRMLPVRKTDSDGNIFYVGYLIFKGSYPIYGWILAKLATYRNEINVDVGRVGIQIEIYKGWCTANRDSQVQRFGRLSLVREKQAKNKNRVNLYKRDNYVTENKSISWEKQ